MKTALNFLVALGYQFKLEEVCRLCTSHELAVVVEDGRLKKFVKELEEC